MGNQNMDEAFQLGDPPQIDESTKQIENPTNVDDLFDPAQINFAAEIPKA
jgi:hypothetical protein